MTIPYEDAVTKLNIESSPELKRFADVYRVEMIRENEELNTLIAKKKATRRGLNRFRMRRLG